MPTITRGAVAAFILLAAPASFAGARPTVPAAPAGRSTVVLQTREAIRIDGRLSEEMWAAAPVVTDLLQRDPDEGKPATERTEIRVACDDDALYIGARLFDRQPGGSSAGDRGAMPTPRPTSCASTSTRITTTRPA